MVAAVTKNKHLKIVTFLLRLGVTKLSMEKNYHTFVYILSFSLHNDIAQKSCYDLHSTRGNTLTEVIICLRLPGK